MKQNYPWVDGLKVKPGDVDLWRIEAPPNEAFTFWCLERGKIRPNEYLHWACEHYQLPIVTDEYFNEHPNRKLWQMIQSVANWSPAMLPLEEWDGTIFIACVEPPSEVQWSFPVRYVLANPRQLKALWSELHGEETVVIPAKPAAEEKPIEIKSSVPESENSFAGLQLNLPDSPPEPSTEPMSTVSPVESDGPAGLSLNLPPLPETPVESAPPAEEPALEPSHLELNLNLNTNVAPIHLELQDPNATTPTLQLEITSANKPPVEPKTVKTQVTRTAVNEIPVSQGPILTDEWSPDQLEDSIKEEQVFAWAFQQLRTHYTSSMLLLLVNDKEYKPFRWEKDWKASAQAPSLIMDVTKPSPFRIVHRSKQPYHGPLIENEFTKTFFTQWGYKKTLPAHVTITPIALQPHGHGVLLCVGDAEANTAAALTFNTRVAEKMSDFLNQLKLKAA